MFARTILYVFLVSTVFLFGCKKVKQDEVLKTAHNILSAEEKAEGWELLFDGKTTNGWHRFNKSDVGPGWDVRDGVLVALDKGEGLGGDIVSDRAYANFILKMEWKVSAEANSGIFYHVVEGAQYRGLHETAPEYQIIDDIGWPDPLKEWQKTGANYAMHVATDRKIFNKAGEWNSSKIAVKDSLVIHYLNGEKIVEFKQWTPDWNERVQNGKWKDYPDYGLAKKGRIGLQDHGNIVYFRNIKIKAIK